jgi:hypothetical protein
MNCICLRKWRTYAWQCGLIVFALVSSRASLQAQCKVTDPAMANSIVVNPIMTGHPVKIIAVGTSLMWGNGLKEKDTFRHLVANWVAERTGQPVMLTTFAHSAALLGPPVPGTVLEGDANWGVGDLNYSVPSVSEQIDCAASLPDTTDVDLILLDGCINEVGAETIPLPWTDPNDLKHRTQTACGGTMKTALTHVAKVYPKATVIVVGYFPLVSGQSITGWFHGTQRLKKHAVKVYSARHKGQPRSQGPKLSKSADRDRMADNSELFYQTSKQEIFNAIDDVDKNILHVQQIIFAPLPEVTLADGTRTVDPNFAFGAPEHRLWWVPIPILWHWAFFRDDKYGIRHDECGKYVTNFEEKLVCPVNSSFHPNVAGAKMYADSITAVIPLDLLKHWQAPATQAEKFHP